jgi:predicted ribosome quality control (RQC) complex YloA/Tae2 family protein
VSGGYMRAISTDGSMAAKAKAKTRKSLKQQRLSAFRQFRSPGGFQILVGRNNRQNDELTHAIAKPADIWLHARGVPGQTICTCSTGSISVAAADVTCKSSSRRNG